MTLVTEDMVAEAIPCGPDVERSVAAVKASRSTDRDDPGPGTLHFV